MAEFDARNRNFGVLNVALSSTPALSLDVVQLVHRRCVAHGAILLARQIGGEVRFELLGTQNAATRVALAVGGWVFVDDPKTLVGYWTWTAKLT